MIYLNGDFMPIEQAKISVLDRGFIFGDGVYEVIPVYSRRPFRLGSTSLGFKQAFPRYALRIRTRHRSGPN